MSAAWPTPYFACIFTNQRTDSGADIYEMMAAEMVALAAEQPGFLGVESVRDAGGLGITVSYWESLEALHSWGRQAAHKKVQEMGRAEFYSWFQLRIAEVTQSRQFGLANLDAAPIPPDAAGD